MGGHFDLDKKNQEIAKLEQEMKQEMEQEMKQKMEQESFPKRRKTFWQKYEKIRMSLRERYVSCLELGRVL